MSNYKIDYKIEWMDIYTNFELERCYCSCMGEHCKDCPNFGKSYDIKPDRRMVIKFKDQDCIAEFVISDTKYYLNSGKTRDDFKHS